MKKFLSIFAAVSIFTSACVIPTVHAEDTYTFTHEYDTFIAGTDFEDRYNQGVEAMTKAAGNYLSNIDASKVKLVSDQTHSGSYALYTENRADAAEIGLNATNWSWSYWNDKYDANNRTAAYTQYENL